MNYDPDVFREQFPIVKRFLYHLLYYKALHTAYKENQLQSEFWTHTIDAHLLQAAINWCMVFGSDGCNPTHWKNLSQTQSEELFQSFRTGLLKRIDISRQKWEGYWEEMTNFRNNYAVHRAPDFSSPVPNFDLALKIAYFYDDWIREVISPDFFEEPSLKESAGRLDTMIAPIVDRLIKLTKESQQDAE